MTNATDADAQPQPKRMSILKKLLLGVVVVIGGLLAWGATLPNEFRVARSTTIKSSPAAVFEVVNDFHRWQSWSPWAKLDPNCKIEFNGPDAGAGAVFKWAGNKEVGEGQMTISDCKPNEYIHILLEFTKPFEDKANVEFQFQPTDDQTQVTWAMSGKNNLVGRVICKLMNMEGMIGKDYEKGLAAMKQEVEAAATKPAEPAKKDE